MREEENYGKFTQKQTRGGLRSKQMERALWKKDNHTSVLLWIGNSIQLFHWICENEVRSNQGGISCYS